GLPRRLLGRLHRLRHRRSAGHRPRIHRRSRRRAHGRRIHRRHHRRTPRRLRRPVDRLPQRAEVAARTHAGGDASARRLPVVLGLILGVMMAVDLGGPVNKVAYSFAVAGLATGSVDNPAPWEIMATVMAAGMVPPLAMALATALRPRVFSQAEKENGKAAW